MVELVDSGIITVTKTDWEFNRRFASRRETWLQLHKSGILEVFKSIFRKGCTFGMLIDELISFIDNVTLEMEESIVFTEVDMVIISEKVKILLKKLVEQKVSSFLTDPRRIGKFFPVIIRGVSKLLDGHSAQMGKMGN